MGSLTSRVNNIQQETETLKFELCKAIITMAFHCPQEVIIEPRIFKVEDFNPNLINEDLETLSNLYEALRYSTNYTI